MNAFPMSNFITPVAIAREAGLSPVTVRRYLKKSQFKKKSSESGNWQKFDAEKLPELVALCKSKRKKPRMNQHNAVLKSTLQQAEGAR
jgi:hypothetical protein